MIFAAKCHGFFRYKVLLINEGVKGFFTQIRKVSRFTLLSWIVYETSGVLKLTVSVQTGNLGIVHSTMNRGELKMMLEGMIGLC